jgi:hypothetical protein
VGSEADRMRNAEQVEAFRSELERAEAQRRANSDRTREVNYERKLAVEERMGQEGLTWNARHAQQVEQVAQVTEAVREAEGVRSERSVEQRSAQMEVVAQVREQQAGMQVRGDAALTEKWSALEAAKRAEQAREAARSQAAAEQRERTKAALDNTPLVQPRAFADHTRSKLAQEYPQGVTEESYTEGNKVIIRRVVVNGNRADEYSKVIAKWGTFYFKNGQSITNQIWSKETEGE